MSNLEAITKNMAPAELAKVEAFAQQLTRAVPTVEELAKSLEPQIRAPFEALMKTQQAQIDAQKAELEALKKRDAETTTKLAEAAAERAMDAIRKEVIGNLAELPGDKEGLVKALYSVEQVSKEAAQTIKDTLLTAHKLVTESGQQIFKSYGSSQSYEAEADSAMAEINKRVEAIVTKSAGNLSKAEARQRVLSEDPALYQRYREEHNERQRGRRAH